MSATIKVMYRGEVLLPVNNREMFIEVDDLIHVHYRDLQIDFTRKEFEEFVDTFKKQADSLLKIIDKTDCADELSNVFNGEEYKIWSTISLEHDVVSHPQRISLEECVDGYHLHYRNYNLRLDKRGFEGLKRAFETAGSGVPTASSLEELLELFKLNRIPYELRDEDKVRSSATAVHKIVMTERHLSKARSVMVGIEMEGRLKVDSVMYSKPGLAVELIEIEDEVPPVETAPPQVAE